LQNHNIKLPAYENTPEFDVISEDPKQSALIVIERLNENNITNVKETTHPKIGELIPEHIEIQINNETVAYIYKPVACHNYNTVTLDNVQMNIATIDTMLSFYLAFLYVNKNYYYKDRILCIAKFLFEVEQKNRLEQKGLLKRFSIQCYGKSSTIENIRAEKAKMFQVLKDKKNTEEYERWFLKYNPLNNKNTNSNLNSKTYTKKKYPYRKNPYRKDSYRKNPYRQNPYRKRHFLFKNTRKRGRKKDIWLI
jgi:hypothetical protein